MKVRLKTTMAGPKGVFLPESAVEVSNEEAEALIAGGFAVALEQGVELAVAGPAPVETAAVEPGERAVKPAARARKTQ